MEQKTLKVCLIGCGRAGMIHGRNYIGNVKNAQLVALCDPVEACLAAAQEEVHAKYTYTDYKDVMANPEIDAVIVVTPTKFHRDS